jgi:hypothetical protein
MPLYMERCLAGSRIASHRTTGEPDEMVSVSPLSKEGGVEVMHGRGGQAVRWTKHSDDSVVSPYRHTAPRMSTDHAHMASSEVKEACCSPSPEYDETKVAGARGPWLHTSIDSKNKKKIKKNNWVYHGPFGPHLLGTYMDQRCHA